jgi:hypothetical protein
LTVVEFARIPVHPDRVLIFEPGKMSIRVGHATHGWDWRSGGTNTRVLK